MRIALLCTTGLLTSLAGAALAQNETFDLGTIVLRGELQERTLQDTQSSVAVVTGEELEQRGDQELYDVIERTPGVTATQGEQGFSIRGINQRGLGAGTGLTISVQTDGVALPTNESTFFGPYSVWDLDQIEVYRGPQSTQQGRNALAGAIIIRTKDPSYEQEASIRAEYGSRDFYRFAVLANTPLVEDRLAFRFAAVTQREDGFVFNPTLNSPYDPSSIDEIRFKLRWNPTDRFEAILSHSITENFGGEDFIEEAFFPARINRSDVFSFEGSRHRNTGLRLSYSFVNGHVLEYEGNHYVNRYQRQEDFDFSPQQLGILSANGGSTVVEHELRYRFETESAVGVIGAFYTDIDNSIPSTLNTDLGFSVSGIPNNINIILNSNFATQIENYALFGEVEFDADGLLPGLNFVAGARYDIETLSFQSTEQTALVGSPLPPANTISGSTTYEAFLPKVGAIYEFSPEQQVSLTYQRGYRAGSARLNIATGVVNQPDPEFTDTIELAYRGTLLQDRLRIAGNAYYTFWQDQQVFVNGPNFATNRLDRNLVNAGESELWGFEISADGDMTEDLSVFASYAYNETRFIDFVADTAGGQVNLEGFNFPDAPENTFAMGGTYRFNAAWSLSADVSYTEGAFSDVFNTPTRRTDERWLTNLQLNFRQGGFSAGLFVRNLFDVDYRIFRIENRSNPSLPPGAAPLFDIRAGDPRTVGFFLQQDF